MKKVKCILFIVSLVLTSCATVKQNVDARVNLTKCTWEFSKLTLRSLDFGDNFTINGLTFDVYLKVTNKADTDVAIDHVKAMFRLDSNDIIGADHNKFTRIPVGKDATDPFGVTIPVKGILNQIGTKPKTIGVKAKLWLTLLIGKDTWETPIVFDIDVNYPIPYDEIDKMVDLEKKRVENEASEKAKKAAEEKLKQEAEKKAKDAASQVIQNPF